MNITEFSTPFSTSYNATNSSSAGSSSASVDSSQGSPNPQLWNMSAFGILSGPLPFVTIILPVIMGPITRWLLKTYIRLKRFWRLVYVFMGVVIVALYYTPDTNVVGLMLCDIPILAIACKGVWDNFRSKEIKLYGCFFILVVGFFYLDFSVSKYFPFGLLGWVMLLWMQRRGSTFDLRLPRRRENTA